jgi:ubiquinone/menaquinone biosynthesis C-methylase UbiE
MVIAPSSVGSYSQLASEYYDPRRHPTCANFREASAAMLRPWFGAFLSPGTAILETGAGASIVCELADELKLQVLLILSDQSPEMLSKSNRRSFDRRLVSNAEQLSIRSRSVDAIAASLGDPYNTLAFWRECARVLRPGGRVFFTTPSFNWANSFRGETSAPLMAAEFALAKGGTLLVPSFVLQPNSQVELVRSAGLEVEQIIHVDTSDIRHTKPSPKLRPGALVTGYRAALR